MGKGGYGKGNMMQQMMQMMMMGGGMGGMGGGWGKGKGKGGQKQVQKKKKQLPVGDTVKPEKIKGTEIRQQKGGGYIRVVTQDGKEFPASSTKAVMKHLKSLGIDPTPVLGVKKAKTPEQEEAHRAKMMEKAELKLASENRNIVNDSYINGEILGGGSDWVWVKPDDMSSIPAQVKGKLQAMNNEIRSKAKKSGKVFLQGQTAMVVYCRAADFSDSSMEAKPGVKVMFKLYTDTKGVGGCDLMAA